MSNSSDCTAFVMIPDPRKSKTEAEESKITTEWQMVVLPESIEALGRFLSSLHLLPKQRIVFRPKDRHLMIEAGDSGLALNVAGCWPSLAFHIPGSTLHLLQESARGFGRKVIKAQGDRMIIGSFTIHGAWYPIIDAPVPASRRLDLAEVLRLRHRHTLEELRLSGIDESVWRAEKSMTDIIEYLLRLWREDVLPEKLRPDLGEDAEKAEEYAEACSEWLDSALRTYRERAWAMPERESIPPGDKKGWSEARAWFADPE